MTRLTHKQFREREGQLMCVRRDRVRGGRWALLNQQTCTMAFNTFIHTALTYSCSAIHAASHLPHTLTYTHSLEIIRRHRMFVVKISLSVFFPFGRSSQWDTLHTCVLHMNLQTREKVQQDQFWTVKATTKTSVCFSVSVRALFSSAAAAASEVASSTYCFQQGQHGVAQFLIIYLDRETAQVHTIKSRERKNLKQGWTF